MRCSSHEQCYSTLSPARTGMGNCLRAGIPPRYVTKPTRSTQLWMAGGKGGDITYAGWRVTLWDPIRHVNSHKGEREACSRTAMSGYFTLGYLLMN